MSKKYGTFLYGVNKYSAASILTSDALTAAAFAVASDGDLLAGASATVAGIFSMAATANAYFGAGSQAVGLFSLSAEAVVVGVKRGEALITATFDIFAAASISVNSASSFVAGEFEITLDPYIGPYWGPEVINSPWTPVFGGSDIWTKQADPALPWSN